MKSITIHGINDDLSQKIMEKSKEFGLSQNRTVKTILENILLSKQKTNRRKMFSDLFGKWSDDEKIEFENRISDFEQINESDWKK